MNDTYIREMIAAISKTKGVTVAEENRLYDILTRYWGDYAISLYDKNDVWEAAQFLELPMSIAEAREVLFLVEDAHEKGGDLSKDTIEEAVQDWFDTFNWVDPDDPIDYDAFEDSCDWLIAHKDERGVVTKLEIVDSRKTLGAAILRAEEIQNEGSQPDGVIFQVYAHKGDEEELDAKRLLFSSDTNFFEGFGTPRFLCEMNDLGGSD